MKRHRHGPHCGCPKEVVYPTKQDVVHNCSEDTVKHVHPSHTTVMNHHLQKNVHVFPHSTSVQNTFDSVDVYGGSYQVPPRPGAGAGPGVAGPGVGPGFAPGAPGMGAPGMGGPGVGGPGAAPGFGQGVPAQGGPTGGPGMMQGGPGMGPGTMPQQGPGFGQGNQRS